MSIIADWLIVGWVPESLDREMADLNREVAKRDVVRGQTFREIDMSHAGGVKFFIDSVWAAAFNHLAPSEVEEAIRAVRWGEPKCVFVYEHAYDYEREPRCRTVAQILDSDDRETDGP